MENTKALFDCMITCGELDPERYGHYKEGTVIREVAKHNVTQEDALTWHGSAECIKRVFEFEDLGREKFGKNHWRKWKVSYFWTTAKKRLTLKLVLMLAFYYVNKFLDF